MMNFDFRVGCMPAVYAIPLKYGHLPIFSFLSSLQIVSQFYIFYFHDSKEEEKNEKEKRKNFLHSLGKTILAVSLM